MALGRRPVQRRPAVSIRTVEESDCLVSASSRLRRQQLLGLLNVSIQLRPGLLRAFDESSARDAEVLVAPLLCGEALGLRFSGRRRAAREVVEPRFQGCGRQPFGSCDGSEGVGHFGCLLLPAAFGVPCMLAPAHWLAAVGRGRANLFAEPEQERGDDDGFLAPHPARNARARRRVWRPCPPPGKRRRRLNAPYAGSPSPLQRFVECAQHLTYGFFLPARPLRGRAYA